MKEITKSVGRDVFNIGQASQEIRSLHISILNKTLQAFELSVKLGEKLIYAKENLPHGQFKKFIEQDVKIVSLRTAQRYMQFYFKQDELREKLGESLDITKATKYISSLSSKKSKDKTVNDKDHKALEETKKTLDYHHIQRKEAIKRFKKGKVLPSDKPLLLEEYIEKKQKKEEQLNKTEISIQKARARLERLLSQKEAIEQGLKEIEQL